MGSRRHARLEALGQLGIFDRHAPHEETDTSRAAAASHSTEDLNRLEGIVYDVIASAKDGATDDEIEVVTGLSHQCASARRRGLVLKDRVKDSGKRRKTRSGRSAAVWVQKDLL